MTRPVECAFETSRRLGLEGTRGFRAAPGTLAAAAVNFRRASASRR